MKNMLFVLVTFALAFFFLPCFVIGDQLSNGRLDPIEPIVNCQSSKDIWVFGDNRCYTYWRDTEGDAEIICGDDVHGKETRRCVVKCTDYAKRGLKWADCDGETSVFGQTIHDIKSKVYKLTQGRSVYP